MPVKVKICGITNEADALAAVDADADFLGFIFCEKSKRYVSPAAAARVVAAVAAHSSAIRHVGVFVDAPIQLVRDVAARVPLSFVQLHGAESPQYCTEARGGGLGIIKAFRFGPGAPAAVWSDYRVDYFLCDTFDPAMAGGTGMAFDPALLPPRFPLGRAFLAGGLTVGNVGEIVRAQRPFAVDVSSGVEASPGRKDHDLVRAFIAAARGAGDSA